MIQATSDSSRVRRAWRSREESRHTFVYENSNATVLNTLEMGGNVVSDAALNP